MSANKTRNGPALHATITTVGTEGTSADVRAFQLSGKGIYVRPCVIHNNHATENVFVKVNAATASATVFDFKVGPDEYLEASLGNVINVETLSLYMGASGDYDDIRTFGWSPTGTIV